MTVTTNTSRISYTGDAASTVFAVPFLFLNNADIKVYVDGVQVTTGFATTGAGTGTGNVTFTVAPASGAVVLLVRNPDFLQNTDLPSNGPFPSSAVEALGDKAMIGIQRVADLQSRSLALDDGEAVVDMTLPALADRASSLLAFDAGGLPVAPPFTTNQVASAVAAAYLGGAASTLDALAFVQAGTGAVSRSAQDKMREVVSAKDFGAVGDGVTDDTAAVQAAINTGKTVDLLGYKYKVNNLTVTTAAQCITSSVGIAQLIKNANGPIVTASVGSVEFRNVSFRGDASAPVFTGDNVVASGDDFHLINCGSRWASGRAVKATGSHTVILGTCDIYQTADATGTGYDIEIGKSGTATLYHELAGILSTQNTGGILLTDTGSATIRGGQFGKLKIAAGTSPSGVNGGKTIGARILGAVSIGVSNALFAGNQFSAVAVTISAGVTNTRIDKSNTFEVGATLVNNSGAGVYHHLERFLGAKNGNNTLTNNGMVTQYGDDSTLAFMAAHPDTGFFEFFGRVFATNFALPNNAGFEGRSTAGTLLSLAKIDASDNLIFGGNYGNFTQVSGSSNGLYLAAGGTSIMQTYSGGIRPNLDNTYNCGTASQRWALLFAGSATVQTSDARLKQQVRPLSDVEKAVAIRAKGLLRAFKFNDAVEAKGDGARIHFGVMAQDLSAAFAAEGLDASKYGVLCFDTWEAQDEIRREWPEEPEVLDDDGNVVQEYKAAGFEVIEPAREAGDRYGVRYEELLAFIIAAI